MRVLFDITHPAHVHFYRNLHQRLIDSGHDVLVVGREKDVTLELLDAYRISHLIHGRSGSRGLIRQGIELASRVAYLVRHGRRFRPDLVLTRNPAGVQAARVIGALGVFDTDDAQSVGLHFRAAAPFADVITGPDGIEGSLGKKERRYPSYKPLAYLHPDLYEPVDPRAQLGLEPGERYSVLRLVAHDASHDRGIEGLDRSSVRRIIELVASIGPVFATVEPGAEAAGMVRSLDVPPERLHDVLAHAAVLVGDSQSVTAEAAVLGTPAFRINSWAGRTPLTDLSAKYEVAHSFPPDQIDAALGAIADALRPEAKEEWARKRELLLADKVNLTDWYWDLVHDLAS